MMAIIAAEQAFEVKRKGKSRAMYLLDDTMLRRYSFRSILLMHSSFPNINDENQVF